MIERSGNQWFLSKKDAADHAPRAILRALLVVGLSSGTGGAIARTGGEQPGTLPAPLSTTENGILPGCAGDGKTDDTACVQYWIDKRQGGILNLGTGTYLISSALVSKGAITLSGAGGGKGIYKQSCSSGLRTNNPRQDVLVLEGAGARVHNICIDANVEMQEGTAIRIVGSANSVIVSDSHINNQIVGISVSGTGSNRSTQNADVILRHNTIVPAAHSKAVGIMLGGNSRKANTIDTRVEGNSLVCQGKIGTGTLILDAGGALISNNTQYGCALGTKIYPGSDQQVIWIYFTGTVLGDTDTDHNLLIDTQVSNAGVWGLNFVNTWASNAGGSSILIQDNGASHNILGIHFIGHRTHVAKDRSGIEVKAGQKVTFDSGTICSDGNGKGTGFIASGDTIASAVRNSTIGNCDHNTDGRLATGILVSTNAENVGIFTGNDLSTTALPIAWRPAAGNESAAILGKNLGLDTAPGMVAANTTVNLPPNRAVFLSGGTPVKWLNGGWAGRETMLYPTAGPISFEAGGNICSAVTADKRQRVSAVFEKEFGCWSLR